MNELFGGEVFNADHDIGYRPEFGISFEQYNLTSFNCAYIKSTVIIEQTLQDTYGMNILTESGEKITMDEYRQLVTVKAQGTTGIMVQSIDMFDLSNINLTSFTSSLNDGGGIINKKFDPRNLKITLFIQGKTYADLLLRIDELKANLQKVEGNLDINVMGRKRRFIATLQSLTFPSFGKSDDFIEGVEADFIITSPLWFYPEQNQEFIPNATANFTKVVKNVGTWRNFPTVKIITNNSTLNSVTVGLRKLGDVDEYQLSVNQTMPPNSVLEINYQTKIVTLNGQEINFSGVMTPMEIGENVFSFYFTGSVNVNTYILYNPTFL